MRIVYPNKAGDGICIIAPNLNSGLTLEEIAKKDVPPGVPFKFIDEKTFPTDRYFRNTWEEDFSSPDGHGSKDGVTLEDSA